MARRALDHWGPEVGEGREAWSLLADAYPLLRRQRRGRRSFRKLARDARARERAAKRPAADARGADGGGDREAGQGGRSSRGCAPTAAPLPLPIRVAALRELGRDEDAWALLEAAGLTDDKRLIGSEDAAALVADVRDLREKYLSGAWAWGQSRQIRPAGHPQPPAGASSCARAGLLFGLEGEAASCGRGTRQTLLPNGDREQRVHLIAKLRGEVRRDQPARAGPSSCPRAIGPACQLEQFVSVAQGGSR